MIAGVVIGTIALLLVVGAVVAIRIVRTKNAARKSTDNYNALETVKKDTTSTGTASYQWQPTSTGTASYQWQPTSTGTASYQWQPTPDAVPLSAGSESDHLLDSTTPALSTWTAPSTK
jgi:type II secretory pathway pseudopilin PulG